MSITPGMSPWGLTAPGTDPDAEAARQKAAQAAEADATKYGRESTNVGGNAAAYAAQAKDNADAKNKSASAALGVK